MTRAAFPSRPSSFALLLFFFIFILLSWLETTAPISQPLNLQFSHPGGYYSDTFFLELSGEGTIWFTLDGRSPTPTTANRYTTPIPLYADQPQVVIVRAWLETADHHLSPVISHSYFLNTPTNLPLLSLIVEPDDFWGAEQGIITHYEEHGRDWERLADVTFVEAEGQPGFHITAGVRVHGRGSRPFEKKSLRLYFRDEYGLSRLNYPLFTDFSDQSVQSFKRLVLHNSGQDSIQPGVNWTLIRNQIAASLAHSIGANATRSRPAILFVNGQFWGIYQIRERIDQFFLDDHYGVENADLLDTPEELIRTDHVSLGDREHWDNMMDFVMSQDLTDPANYAYLATQMDMNNYIDYNLLQIYIANDDWPHHNMSLFRPQTVNGRWQWLIWDSDRSFAFRIASPVGKDMIAHAQTNVESASGRQVILLQKLLDNPEFRNAFLVRLAMLLNTDFSPEAVLPQIESLAATIAPAIPHEVGRWPADGNTWATNIEELRDFARRRPEFVRQHVVRRFDLPGTAVLHLNPSAKGAIQLEDRHIQNEWEGVFFQGTIVQVTAVAQPGYHFTGWQEIDGPATLDLAIAGEQTLTPQFAPLPDDVPRVGDVLITAVTPTFIQLRTTRALDLRGWRLTDNDSPTATDEGSLIFTDDPALKIVPADTILHIDLTGDVGAIDGTIVLSKANGRLDTETDPWFHLQQHDVLVLLAPGQLAGLSDDQTIAIMSTDVSIDSIIITKFNISPYP